jgi:uncharacterized Tic20 family protein
MSEANASQSDAGKESKNLAVLTWIGTLFLGFIPGLIIYLIKKDDPYVTEQAKESLNWSITAMIGFLAGILLTMVLIGVFITGLVSIVHLVFCIMGAISTSKGKNFKAPFAIRLLK